MNYNKSCHENDPTPRVDEALMNRGNMSKPTIAAVARDLERELNWWKQKALTIDDTFSRIRYPDNTGQ